MAPGGPFFVSGELFSQHLHDKCRDGLRRISQVLLVELDSSRANSLEVLQRIRRIEDSVVKGSALRTDPTRGYLSVAGKAQGKRLAALAALDPRTAPPWLLHRSHQDAPSCFPYPVGYVGLMRLPRAALATCRFIVPSNLFVRATRNGRPGSSRRVWRPTGPDPRRRSIGSDSPCCRSSPILRNLP